MIGSFDKTNLEKLPEGMNLVERGHILGDWFVFRDDRHFGPLSSQQVRGFLESKLLSTGHHIWRPGFDGWTAISEIEGFKSYGKAKIKIYSDEEFSYKGKLGHIDRIGKEVSSLDFAEGAKPYTREEIEASVLHKEEIIKNVSLRSMKSYFGFGADYLNLGRLMGALIVASVIGAIMFKNIEARNLDALSGLKEDASNVLRAASAGSDNRKDPEFKAIEKSKGVADPVLIFGTDLPIGTNLVISITGIEGTLLGSYRFFQSTPVVLTEKIFKTSAIREVSGKFIPPGNYNVQVTCVDCVENNKIIYDQAHTFGVSNQVEYQKNLSSYQAEVREDIGLELDELEDLSFAIFAQYKDSANMFMDFSVSKNLAGWQKFSAEWLVKQKKLIDLFAEVKTEKFQSSVYFIDYYNAYEKVVTRIFELHLLQDSTLVVGRNSKKNSAEMSNLVREANRELSVIKAQLQISRIEFNRASGMPKAPKLNL